MRRHSGPDRFDSLGSWQRQVDREFVLDYTFAVFARRFTRWFLRPHRRVILEITNRDTGDRLVLSAATRDPSAEFTAFRARFNDQHFEVKTYDGRLLFRSRS